MENTQKNILYVITKANFGGAQRYVADLARYQTAHGWNVSVVHGENSFEDGNIFDRLLEEAGVRIMHVPGLGRDVNVVADIKVFFKLLRLFKEENADIVHLNSSKIGALGALAARIARCPRIVYTAHGLPHLEPRALWQRAIIKAITWVTFVLSHAVVVVSDSEHKEVRNWPLIGGKVTRIYNGVGDVDFFSREEAQELLSARVGKPIANTLVIGSMGELTKNKGLAPFLSVLKKIKEDGLDFIYVHFGTGELKEQLEEEALKEGLEGNIVWFGFDANASLYFKALDIFVLPSLKEGLPYAVLDAGLAGVAIATSNVGGIPEILAEGAGVLVNRGDMQTYVTELEALMADDEKRNVMGKQVQQRIKAVFSKDEMVQKTTALQEGRA